MNVEDAPGNISTPTCNISAALNTALKAIPTTLYNYVYKFGTGGPDVKNIKDFKITLNASNNSLDNFELHTNNGNPNWYVDLKNNVVNKSLNSSSPSLTLAKTPIKNLDGTYYAFYDNGNFVLVDKAGKFILYFSNSPTASSCSAGKLREGSEVMNVTKTSLKVTSNSVVLNFCGDKNNEVILFNSKGLELNRTIIEGNTYEVPRSSFQQGLYIFHVNHDGITDKIKFMIE